MLIFSIIIYTLFGGMCLWFIISGVQKLKEVRSEQESAASEKAQEKAAEEEKSLAENTEEM